MKNFFKRTTASLVLITMLVSCVPTNFVHAQDSEKANVIEGEAINSSTESNEIAELEEGTSEASNKDREQEERSNEQSQTSEELAVDGDIEREFEFIFIEKPVISTSDTQNIVIQWNEEVTVEQTSLVLLNEKGENVEIPCDAKEGNLYLFSKVFEEEESNIYTLHAFRIIEENGVRDVYFTDMNVVSGFGVNKEMPDHQKSEHVELDEDEQEIIDGIEVNEDTLDASVAKVEVDGGVNTKATAAEIVSALETSGVMQSQPLSANIQAFSGSTPVVVGLDVGHDATHGGAVGIGGVKEEYATLQIALAVKAELEAYGVQVLMSRQGMACENPSGTGVLECIRKNVDKLVDGGAQVIVSLHLNATGNGAGHGTEVWYYPGEGKGQALASSVLSQLAKLLYNRGTKEEEWAVVDQARIRGVFGILVESFFMDNSEDAGSYLNTNGYRTVGTAIATGIANYYSLKKGYWKTENGINYWYESGKKVVNAWRWIGGYRYYFTATGEPLKGWQKVSGVQYYFDNTGRAYMGWQTYNGKQYYFCLDDCRMATDWVVIDGNNYHFDKEGQKEIGWITVGIHKYYTNSAGVMQTCWQKIDGHYFWFHYPGGNMATGWVKIADDWYYFNSKGEMQTGWLSYSGRTYYLSSGGGMLTGFGTIEGKRYYFNQDGIMQKGWQSISGYRYYFDSDGVMAKGIVTIDGKKYFFNANGQACSSGWLQDKGIWYYLKSSSGIVAIGWEKIGSYWYYFNSKGEMQTGWLDYCSRKYYLSSGGGMLTGLRTIDKKGYYFNADGIMQKGWQTISGYRYYFDSEGVMVTGIIELDGKKYFFNANGQACSSGWIQDKGIWYYLKSSSGIVAVGWEKIGSYWYYFNSKGEMQTGWLDYCSRKYYLSSGGGMLTGLRTIDKKGYYFNADGIMQKGWQTILGYRYYFDSEGVMAVGIANIDGKIYYFNDQGQNRNSTWITYEGYKYYIKADGEPATGWLQLQNKWYWFNNDGKMQVGWLTLGANVYYLDDSGVMQEGIKKIDNKFYFFAYGSGIRLQKVGWTKDGNKDIYVEDASGVLHTGWLEKKSGEKTYFYYLDPATAYMKTGWIYLFGYYYYLHPGGDMASDYWLYFNKNWYYLHPGGDMAKGKGVEVRGVKYDFKDSGELDSDSMIIAPSTVTVGQLVRYYQKYSSITFPSYYASNDKEAKTLEAFCQIYFEEATAQGIRPEVAFTQAMKETGFLKFGGDVVISQFNFAGIGTTGGGVKGNSFRSVRIGIRAQIQHLYAYASPKGEAGLVYPNEDPRFDLVTKGCAPTIEGLEGRWATGVGYSGDILKMINALMSL